MTPQRALGEYAFEATKAAPPITVGGLTLVGIPLQEWVLILTAVYTLIQIGVLVYKGYKIWKARK